MSSSQQLAGAMEVLKAFHPLFACPSLEPVHRKREMLSELYNQKCHLKKKSQNGTCPSKAPSGTLRASQAAVWVTGRWGTASGTGDTVWSKMLTSGKQEEKHGQERRHL